MSPRRLIVAVLTLIVIVPALVAYYMYAVAPRWLQIQRLRIGIAGLPAEWRGVRIAHLSDFHVGHSRVAPEVLREARDQAIACLPDIVALTGDYFDDGEWAEQHHAYGDWPAGKTFAVMGNHDHRGGVQHVDRVTRLLTASGAKVLSNEAVCVELRGRDAWIAAVDDPYSGRDDIFHALDAVPDAEPALLLLAHAPTVADIMPVGAVRLMLCGHTHGGQIRLLPSGKTPFLGLIHWLIGEPPRIEPSIHHGQHWKSGAVVCISNGLGMSQLPLRFRTRPQLTLIELDEVSSLMEPCDAIERYVTDETAEPWLARWLS